MTDDRGDVVELLEADHIAFGAYRYDVYGRPTETTARTTSTTAMDSSWMAPITENRSLLRYAGYVYDAHSELYYLQRRYYDAILRQFLSRDPLKSDGPESPYQYCRGNPVAGSDPWGLMMVQGTGAGGGQNKKPTTLRHLTMLAELRALEAAYGAGAGDSQNLARFKGVLGRSDNLPSAAAGGKGLVNCGAGAADFALSTGWDMSMSLNPVGGIVSRFLSPPQVPQPFHGPGLDLSYGIGTYVVGPAALGLAGGAGAARGAGGVAVSGTSTRTGKLLFTNRFVGVNSRLLGNSGAGGESGLLNRSGSWLKFGWSSSPKFGGGWHLRLGIGRNPAFPNKARWHGDFRSTRVSNSDAKGLLDLIQGQ